MHPEITLLDVNNDDKVDVSDIMVIVQDIVDKKLYDYKKDINNDGKVDEEDVQILLKYILGRR